MEPISPELALVDPELRAAARARLPDAPWEAFAPPSRVLAGREPPVEPQSRGLRAVPSLLLLALAAGIGAALVLVDTSGTQRPWLAEPQSHAATGDAPRTPPVAAPSPDAAGTPQAAPAPPPGIVTTPSSPDRGPRLRAETAPPRAATEGEAQRTPDQPPAADVVAPPAVTAPQGGTPPPGAAPRTRTATVPAEARRPETFVPARTFAWPPDPRASYYDVQFFRDGGRFFRAQPREARLELPPDLSFPAGRYRWVVRPGRGTPSQRRLGDPIVDSTFTVG
jgi:hypothetical protein